MVLAWMSIVGLVGVVVGLKLLLTLCRRARSPLASLPGPWYSKWTGAVLFYHYLRGKRPQYVERLHQIYGSTVRVGPNEVDFSSIAAAKRIHSYTRPLRKAQMYDDIAVGGKFSNIFATRDFEYHQRHRRLLSAPISEAGLKSVEHVIDERARLAVHSIGEEAKSKGSADVMKWWLFFSTDVIGELTFGDSFRMLEQGRDSQYSSDLKAVGKLGGLRIAFPLFIRWASYVPLPIFRETFNATLRMRAYASESIQRHERIVAADPWNPKPTLFTKLFRAGEEGMSQFEIVSDAQSYIIAGSDTTAHTMTYLVWAVCRHESVKRQLAEEVATLSEGYTDEDLKALPYLNQVIHETLRLYAAAPAALPRDAPPDGCEIDGQWIPAGTTVSTQAYSMHRNPAVFPEPEKFLPFRWQNPTKEMKDAWMPFGGGARVCLGLHLALLELRHATAKFFRAYPNPRVSHMDGFGNADMEEMIYFLLFPKNKRCLIEI